MASQAVEIVRLDSALNHRVSGPVASGAVEPKNLMLLVDEAEVTTLTADVVGTPTIVNSPVAVRTHLSVTRSACSGGRGYAGTDMTHGATSTGGGVRVNHGYILYSVTLCPTTGYIGGNMCLSHPVMHDRMTLTASTIPGGREPGVRVTRNTADGCYPWPAMLCNQIDHVTSKAVPLQGRIVRSRTYWVPRLCWGVVMARYAPCTDGSIHADPMTGRACGVQLDDISRPMTRHALLAIGCLMNLIDITVDLMAGGAISGGSVPIDARWITVAVAQCACVGVLRIAIHVRFVDLRQCVRPMTARRGTRGIHLTEGVVGLHIAMVVHPCCRMATCALGCSGRKVRDPGGVAVADITAQRGSSMNRCDVYRTSDDLTVTSATSERISTGRQVDTEIIVIGYVTRSTAGITCFDRQLRALAHLSLEVRMADIAASKLAARHRGCGYHSPTMLYGQIR
ncbi:MAG: hypothetical protein M1617_04270 [Actinobacteria bacterium]|nr:hypothetical protein [Actinomycetota bacterium]